MDQADNQLKAAQAAQGQVEALRAQAALAREFSTVIAPFDGVVLATHAQVGELATPGRPIATVYTPGAMRAVVQVPQARQGLAHRAKAMVVLPDGRNVAPKRVQALAAVDATAQTVEWRLDLAEGDAGLPGQSVTVRFFEGAAPLATPDRSALRLPVAALLRRGELEAVYVVRDQRFVLRHVRAGATVGNEVEVLAGLQPGERVALDAVKAGLRDARAAP